MDFSLAWTRLCFRNGLFLNAITGGSGNIELRVLSLWISFQLLLQQRSFFFLLAVYPLSLH